MIIENSKLNSQKNRKDLQGGQGYELKSPYPYNSTDVATAEESRSFKFSD
jgi:hypothetical protein